MIRVINLWCRNKFCDVEINFDFRGLINGSRNLFRHRHKYNMKICIGGEPFLLQNKKGVTPIQVQLLHNQRGG